MNAREFFYKVVKPTVTEFTLDGNDLRRAILACIVLKHATEHVFVERALAQSTPSNEKTALKCARDQQSKYWDSHSSDSSFNAVENIANASKHARLVKTGYSLQLVHLSDPAGLYLDDGFLDNDFMTWSSQVMAHATTPGHPSPPDVELKTAIESVMMKIQTDFPELAP
jgi:hypothetical protein